MPRKTRRARKEEKDMNAMKCGHYHHGCWGGAYSLGFIGAAVYYIQQATGFWAGVVGVLKALVWPAFVVYKLLGL